LQGRPSAPQQQWRRKDSRAAAAEGGRTGGSGPSSSSLSSYAGGEGHRHLQQGKQRTTTIDFSFVFLFCSADLHLSSQLGFFSFPLCSLFQAVGGVTIGLLAFGFCSVCSCRWPVNLWTALLWLVCGQKLGVGLQRG
jgi:hypothetical protein